MRLHSFPVVLSLSVALWGGAARSGDVVPAKEPGPAKEPAAAAPSGPAPHLVFDAATINVGDVVHGQDAVAAFSYKNTGEAPLHILAARPGCGCTVATFDPLVPPGETGKIRASVRTAAYRGPITKQVTVEHDDKSQGPVQLTISANIVGSVEILPYAGLQLTRRRQGFLTPATLIVRQDATEKGALAMSDLAVSAPWLKITSRKVTADEAPTEGLPAAKPGDVILSVQAEKSAPVGSHVETLTFKTGLTREPAVTIPVTVYVQPVVSLQPNELVLNPAADSKQTASGQVLAALRDDVDPKSVTVKSESKDFSVRIDPSGAQAFRLLVDWSGKGKHAATSTKIHVSAGKETIDLPVRIAPI